MDRSHQDRNDQSRARLRAFVERLTDEELARPHGDGWTAAAELAHVAFWDRRAAVLLARWARDGVSPSGVDVDAINDAMLPQWLLLPPRVAADEALAAADLADAAVRDAGDDVLARIGEGGVIRLDRSHHRLVHLEPLERRFP